MLRALLLCAAARAVRGGKQGKPVFDIQFLDTFEGAHAFVRDVKINPSKFLACSLGGTYGMREWLSYQDARLGGRAQACPPLATGCADPGVCAHPPNTR